MKVRVLALSLSLVLLFPCLLTGCQKQPEVIYQLDFKTTQEVVEFVLHYTVDIQTDDTVESQAYAARVVANHFAFQKYHAPKYGASQVEQNPDGSFTVIVEGNITGQLADGKTIAQPFTLTALVTSRTAPPQITVEALK